ncbi:MAG: peroxiredoxin family protein [Natronosporangium sp.]
MTTSRAKPRARVGQAATSAASGAPTKAERRERAAAARQKMTEAKRRANHRRTVIRWGAGAVLAALVIGGLYLIFAAGNQPPDGESASGYRYEVGDPGPGEPAPEFTLAATTGEQVSLADFRDQTVLLYFHEGGMCQPCFDQIRDLEQEWDKVAAAGVDELVTITVEPVDLLAQNMRDDNLSSTALSDPDLAVSRTYTAEQYGMMGGTTPGHSFILVDPDGTIRWRADYGGAPDYTMYVPVDAVLADLAADTTAAGQG